MTHNNSLQSSKIGYASSHSVVKLSAKRYEQSPYLERYISDDIVFGLYANRFYPLSLGGDPVADYWRLRQGVMLYDVPEKPLEIKGPDAVTLLEKVFSRKVGNLRQWRARYAIACTPQGHILMDGVLIRLAEDHFYYVQANGPFETWLLAHTAGLDVTVRDPGSWVIQIQGPKAIELLHAATTGPFPEKFNYFHAGMFDFAGQELLVTRTGWTGEMGFEIYSQPTTDHLDLWDHLVATGEPFGLQSGSLESMGIRRIEAGILDNGTDIDRTMTPYEAGLGAFIDLDKPEFVGRTALETANQECFLFGLVSESGTPSAGDKLFADEIEVGYITAGGWSPTLEKGIGYARFTVSGGSNSWLHQSITLRDTNGSNHDSQIVSLPFFDPDKRIPRGLSSEG